MKAFILQHLDFEDAGNLLAVLTELNYDVSFFQATRADDLDFLQQQQADLLVVLGGPVGVYETLNYPALEQEKRIIRQHIDQGKRLIGICLGCQLIASVLGGHVYPGHCKEIGWGPVSCSNQVSGTPLAALDKIPVLHWHGDTFYIPPGARRIASSELYPNQGFMVGQQILALQFHLEVLPHRIEDWLMGHAAELSGLDTEAVLRIRQQSEVYAAPLQALARDIWRRWLLQA